MAVALFIFAFAVRIISLLTSGGFDSVQGYDDGVYYSAAAAFNHGLIPYKDFVLVHPPGILIILTPFIWLAHLTSDSFGLTMGRVFFMLIGATSTVLIYKLGRRFNRTAAVIAALIYAVWAPMVRVERTLYLEGIGSLALLLALYLLPKARAPKIRVVFSGLFLGFAVATKLWFAVPVAVITLWFLLSREIKNAITLGLTSLATFGAVISWFWWKAGSKFWDLVLTAQINRNGGHISLYTRIDQIFNFASLKFIDDRKLRFFIGLTIVLLLTLPFLKYFRKREQGLLILMLFATQFVVLLQTPVFFNAYPSFLAATFALIAGITLGQIHRNFLTGTLISLFIVISLNSTLTQIHGRDLPTKIEQLPLQKSKCVTSDDPSILALTNTLTKDLDNNCHLIFDVTGVIYGIDNGANPFQESATTRRLKSARYQKEISKYLESGATIILGRAGHNGLNPESYRALYMGRTVTKTKSFVIIS